MSEEKSLFVSSFSDYFNNMYMIIESFDVDRSFWSGFIKFLLFPLFFTYLFIVIILRPIMGLFVVPAFIFFLLSFGENYFMLLTALFGISHIDKLKESNEPKP